MSQPTVLCVENSETGFVVSKQVLETASGLRLISVTNAGAAIKAFRAVGADATVLDCRFLAAESIAVAARLREIDRTVPQFLFAPAEDTFEFTDRSGLIYIVHDLEKLALLLRMTLAQTRTAQFRQANLLSEARALRSDSRAIVRDIRGAIASMHCDIGPLGSIPKFARVEEPSAAPTDFTRLQMSVCKRCHKVVALTNRVTEQVADEEQHECDAPLKK